MKVEEFTARHHPNVRPRIKDTNEEVPLLREAGDACDGCRP